MEFVWKIRFIKRKNSKTNIEENVEKERKTKFSHAHNTDILGNHRKTYAEKLKGVLEKMINYINMGFR